MVIRHTTELFNAMVDVLNGVAEAAAEAEAAPAAEETTEEDE